MPPNSPKDEMEDEEQPSWNEIPVMRSAGLVGNPLKINLRKNPHQEEHTHTGAEEDMEGSRGKKSFH